MLPPFSDIATTIAAVSSLEQLDELRVALLGKKGSITEELKALGGLPPEERKNRGAEINHLKERVSTELEKRKNQLSHAALLQRLTSETLDTSLPTRPACQGKIHPITQTIEEIISIFGRFGFNVAEGPDIEDEYHNFDALNIPASHPARQMHDTFYLQSSPEEEKTLLLRTHTSPVQIRVMSGGKPPFRTIAPGNTYRCDSDQTHTPMFHQVEGFVIDKNIHMGHLKGVITDFLKAFFELETVPVRFRPSFFPFTEPSAEVDIGCTRRKDSLTIGEGADWLEVLGCGMVHPNVLKNCGLDPEKWQGFAFGMGVERLAMLKYNIPDLRTFFESDARWLNHYGFAPLDCAGV